MSGKPIPAEKMPRVIGDGTIAIKDDPYFSNPLGLSELSEFNRKAPSRSDGVIEYDPAIETGAEKIRRHLRLLTHREMRELAADLFGAYERLHPQVEPTVIKAAIPREALAEVLDRFAHND